MYNQAHISENLETIFWVRILKFFDADPGSKKLGSVTNINIPDPQHWKNFVTSWNLFYEARPSSRETRPGTPVRQFMHFPEQIQPKLAYTQSSWPSPRNFTDPNPYPEPRPSVVDPDLVGSETFCRIQIRIWKTTTLLLLTLKRHD